MEVHCYATAPIQGVFQRTAEGLVWLIRSGVVVVLLVCCVVRCCEWCRATVGDEAVRTLKKGAEFLFADQIK